MAGFLYTIVKITGPKKIRRLGFHIPQSENELQHSPLGEIVF